MSKEKKTDPVTEDTKVKENPKSETTYTEDEYLKMSSSQYDKGYKKAQKELEEKLEREKLSEIEKAQADLKALRDEAEAAKQEAQELKLKTSLLSDKEIKDADYALFKAQQDADKYMPNGQLNIDALKKDFPDLVKPEPKTGPTPANPGGGDEGKKVTSHDAVLSYFSK